jgi:phosphohistidine swiveling domain-containing protein
MQNMLDEAPPRKSADGLRRARDLVAAGQHSTAAPLIVRARAELEAELAQAVAPNTATLAHYFASGLMEKFTGVRSNLDASEIPRRQMVQVLVLDSKREKVLLQKRGPFKRQFANTDSVSANAKVKPGQDLRDAAAAAVAQEVGVTIDTGRLEPLGMPNQYELHLTIASFYAFSNEEEQSLKAEAERFASGYPLVGDIKVRYHPLARALVVFTVNPHAGPSAFQEVVDAIRDHTGIGYIFAFSNSDSGSLFGYALNPSEEAQVLGRIEARAARLRSLKPALPREVFPEADEVSSLKQEHYMPTAPPSGSCMSSGLLARDLQLLDSDSMHFIPWIQVRCESATCSEAFTTVLTGPYFSNPMMWAALELREPGLIRIDDPIASLSCVAGGKGTNTHRLRALADDTFRVPETSVVTTLVFEALICNDPEIGAAIAALDCKPDPVVRATLAETIRTSILSLELPTPLESLIRTEFERLGGDLAIRSSATSEDLKEHQAAGQAHSCLHQITLDSALISIKRVWASLFTDGFVAYRDSIGFPHQKARMAVLLQSFVPPKASGVILSLDQATHRPIYSISAQPGVGEGVVEGLGLSDRWLVGLLGEEILERKIVTKRVRVVSAESGDVEREAIHDDTPSLNDAAILALARSARKIHRHYRENGIADEIDLEYVVDTAGNVALVQARAKPSRKSVSAQRHVFRVRTVDESQVPPGTPIVRLDSRSETAVPGAVVSILQLDPNREPNKCLPGRILVTHHTNNDYNAVFGTLDGVITTDGGQTSHASEHAFEKGIPCVVGSLNALDLLKMHAGQEVTFDAGRRTIYMGVVPIIEEERALDVWATDEAQIRGFLDDGSRHENTREWDLSKQKRPKVFIEDPECHCRRRSATYRYFQLDYFYRAWDRQAEILNRMFAGRSRFTLRPQARQIKVIEDKHQLVHIVTVNDPDSIYEFLIRVNNFGTEDLEGLFESRLDGFRRFAAFAHSVKQIDAQNVECLVDELLNVFSWMHFGFWLDSVIEEFAFRQLRYVSNEGAFHRILREESVRDLPRDYRVDPLNDGVIAGKLLNLSREREKECYALIEAVRADPRLRAVFEIEDLGLLNATLKNDFPEIYGIIDRWSGRYKLTREDLDVLSDMDEYLGQIRARIRSGSSMSADMLNGILRTFLQIHSLQGSPLEAISKHDPNLYLLLRSLARGIIAKECSIALEAANAENIEKRLPEALAQLGSLTSSDARLRLAATQVLRDYPEIKKVLQLSKLQFPLREDAHHLIVPLQRILSRLMLEAADRFVPGVLPSREDVFDLSLEELVALLKEPEPRYISRSRERWQMLLAAEKQLQRTWTVEKADLNSITENPDALWADLTRASSGHGYLDSRGFIQDKFRTLRAQNAMQLSPENERFRASIFELLRSRLSRFETEFAAFECATHAAVQILEEQIAAATLERVRAAYRAEQRRLLERIQNFRNKWNTEIDYAKWPYER